MASENTMNEQNASTGAGKSAAGSDRATGEVAAAHEIFRILHQTYPDARCALTFHDPFELLVATVLSAQTTDKGVNKVTPILFDHYPDAAALGAASLPEVEQIIRPTGFFHNKATAIVGIGQALTENFHGVVPREIDQLTSLPGVGRKTAQVVRGHAFGIPGVTTDTHVLRVSKRLGFTSSTKPLTVERDVSALFDESVWTLLSDTLIFHGRARCHAKKAACGACPVAGLCPSFGIGPTDPDEAERLVRSP